MKLIESKAEYIPQEEGLEGVYKQIELAGRTAYHSLDKITSDSAKSFVDRMIKSRHGAALEHGTVYLKWSAPGIYDKARGHTVYDYVRNPYSKSKECLTKESLLQASVEYRISTNYRVLIENNWLDDLQYSCSPTALHEKRYTMRFTCSRAIAQELTRHRAFSFLMESQRYINYSKERHGSDITFIKPSWLICSYEDIPAKSELCYLAKQHPDEAGHRFIASLVESKYAYMILLQKGCTPQQARDVLPNATKTELIMTGFASDWRFFFDLRFYGETGKPHPDMELLAGKAREEFIKAGLWDNIMKYPSKFDKDDTEGETN